MAVVRERRCRETRATQVPGGHSPLSEPCSALEPVAQVGAGIRFWGCMFVGLRASVGLACSNVAPRSGRTGNLRAPPQFSGKDRQ